MSSSPSILQSFNPTRSLLCLGGHPSKSAIFVEIIDISYGKYVLFKLQKKMLCGKVAHPSRSLAVIVNDPLNVGKIICLFSRP